jgi:hypothetical protein
MLTNYPDPQANHSLFLFINGACFEKKTGNICKPAYIWSDRGSDPRSTTPKESTRNPLSAGDGLVGKDDKMDRVGKRSYKGLQFSRKLVFNKNFCTLQLVLYIQEAWYCPHTGHSFPSQWELYLWLVAMAVSCHSPIFRDPLAYLLPKILNLVLFFSVTGAISARRF